MEKVQSMIPNSSLMAIATMGVTGASLINSRRENKRMKNKVTNLEDKMKSVIRILDKNSLATDEAEDVLRRIKKQQKRIDILEDDVSDIKETLRAISNKLGIEDKKPKRISREKEELWSRRESKEKEELLERKGKESKISIRREKEDDSYSSEESEESEESEDEMLRQINRMM